MSIIVVIDSGINKNHSFFTKKMQNRLIGEYEITHDNTNNKEQKIIDHGTAVNAVLLNYAEKAQIINISIYSSEEASFEEELIKALNFVLNKIDCDIVNISCGVECSFLKSELYNVCNQLVDRNIILVSAFSNEGIISYPAAFNCVIGIDMCKDCKCLSEYEYYDNNIVNIRGAEIFMRLPAGGNEFEYVIGSSFIAPYFSAKIANYIDNGICNKTDILESLKNNAKLYKNCISTHLLKLEYNIKNCIIMPFNKEMHSLLKYQDLIDFNIVDIYDSKYTGRIGKKVSKLIFNYTHEEYIIKNIDSINWEENDFDTIILGHMNEIESRTSNKYSDLIIEKCYKYNKNIYCFDPITRPEYSKAFFSPRIMSSDFNDIYFGKLRRINKPILAVLGTSDKQGKFTLQLELRKILLKNGYKVGQLGTEPSSLLYGMDAMVPFGYNCYCELDDEQLLAYTNYAMGFIENKDVDIIIVGSQSQTINPYWGNLALYPLKQHGFLLATEPDAYILCINADDDINYISRTIKYIDSISCARIVGLVIYPKNKNNTNLFKQEDKFIGKEEIELSKVYYKNKTGIETYYIGNETDLLRLYESTINIFEKG